MSKTRDQRRRRGRIIFTGEDGSVVVEKRRHGRRLINLTDASGRKPKSMSLQPDALVIRYEDGTERKVKPK
jgi:hypothetical protein